MESDEYEEHEKIPEDTIKTLERHKILKFSKELWNSSTFIERENHVDVTIEENKENKNYLPWFTINSREVTLDLVIKLKNFLTIYLGKVEDDMVNQDDSPIDNKKINNKNKLALKDKDTLFIGIEIKNGLKNQSKKIDILLHEAFRDLIYEYILDSQIPIICVVSGDALDMGLELLLACKRRYAFKKEKMIEF